MTDDAEIERLRARVADLEEALLPFAKEAVDWPPDGEDAVPDDFTPLCCDPHLVDEGLRKSLKAQFNAGDLRRAARLIDVPAVKPRRATGDRH